MDSEFEKERASIDSNNAMNTELECRVCRGNEEEGRALYHPCLCTGSIGLVHQDCLEQWLQHSRKDKCELCSTKYLFVPEYASNTPSKIPLPVVIKAILKIFSFKVLPFLFKIITTFVLWVLFVPLWTSWVYRVVLREGSYVNIFKERAVWESLQNDVISGLVIIGVIILSSIILMSFVDFVRTLWRDDGQVNGWPQRNARNNRRRNVNNANNINNVNNPIQLPRNAIPQFEVPIGNVRDIPQMPDNVDASANHEIERTIANDNQSIIGSFDDVDRVNRVDDINLNATGLRSRRRMKVSEMGSADEDDLEVERLIFDNSSRFPSPLEQEIDTLKSNQMEIESDNQTLSDVSDVSDEDDVDDIWDEEDIFPEQLPGEEVRFNWDELLGLRGPIPFQIIKHVVWFLTFTVLYLIVFHFSPLRVGIITCAICSSFVPSEIFNFITEHSPKIFLDIISRSNELSIQLNTAIRLSDIGYNVIGYMTLFALLQIITSSLQVIHELKFFVIEEFVRVCYNILVVCKISSLLSIRIFLFPLSLGIVILSTFNYFIFNLSTDAIIQFVAKNLVGCLTLSWTSGISYMLVVTLSVLQLREIVHPSLLGQHIRPQETHTELLHSLIKDSYGIHFRRLIVSSFVYLILLAMLLFIPLYSIKYGLSWITSSTNPFELKFWFIIPELQLPLEVAIGHFTMLTILESKKNYIGKFIYNWLLLVTKKLNIVRFIMPCPYKVKLIGNTYEILKDKRGNPIILKPLKRPPKGWDARNQDNHIYDNKITTRWAWGIEEPSSTEKNLAPRITPSNWILKLFLLILITWVMLMTCITFVLVVPLAIGRQIYYQLCIPRILQHDPMAFLIGLSICAITIKFIYTTYSTYGWKNIVTKFISKLFLIPLRIVFQFIELSLLWNLTHVGLKLFIELIKNPDTMLHDISNLPYIYNLWINERFTIDILIIIFLNGGLEFCLARFGLQEFHGLVDRCNHVRANCALLFNSLLQGEWDTNVDISPIKKLIIWPLFDLFCVKLGSLLLLSWLLCSGISVFNSQWEFSKYEFLVLSCNRVTSWTMLLYLCSTIFVIPLKSLRDKFYQAVKDENYLTGRRLQNIITRNM